ncbi:AMP-binding protein [uncultured Tateyamaria sp.]|uniref:AMP-binding protein n=1 Tax=uncultured Tateyamaria sp. TaxID=455651 RepID=UPI0026267E49|nr:AMP-binding protein [uncultured Tateyamaria sp.]
MSKLGIIDRTALTKRLTQRGFGLAQEEPGEPSVLQDATPIANMAEKRFWTQEQMDPTPGLNALGIWLEMKVPVTKVAFVSALTKVVQRHDALRTRYTDRDGALHLDVADDLPLPLGAPLGDTTPDSVRQALFDMGLIMAQDTPWQVRLAVTGRNGTDEVVNGVLIGVHHAIMDWGGLAVFVQELDQALDGAETPTSAGQNHGFRHKFQMSRAAHRVQAEAYWQARLDGCPAVLSIPAVQSGSEPTPGYHTRTITLGAEQSQRLCARAAAIGATPFSLLLSAYGLVLTGLSGTPEVVVGTAVSHRDQQGGESIIACLSDLVPLRLALDSSDTVDSTLRGVHGQMAQDIEHAHLGFADTVAASGVARHRDKAPLVQAIFNLLEPMPEGQHLTAQPVYSQVARADIALDAQDHGDLSLRLEVRAAMFTPALADQIAQCLDSAVAHVLVAGSQPLGAVAWPVTLPDTQPSLAPPKTHLGEWLFDRMAAHPGQTVKDGDQVTTFADICKNAEALAAALIDAGVAPGDAVAVHLPRGIAQVTATLACLRAGGVLVLIDPDHPAQRRADVITQSQARVMIGEGIDADLISLVDVMVAPTAKGAGACPTVWPHRDPQDIAYIVFTSGSTGRPKGACGTHQGLLNRLIWMEGAYPWASDDVACFKTSAAFVDALTEMLGPLAAGVASVVAGADVAKDPHALAQFIGTNHVTRIVAVPSLISVWTDHVPGIATLLSPLRLCVSSGEPLTARVLRKMEEIAPKCRVLNLYGASEMSGDVTHHLPTGTSDVIPIGRAMPGNRLAVVDPFGHALPTGFPGELVVSGVALANGYRGATAADQARFAPMAVFDGAVGYATGDRAYLDGSGDVVLLGRKDDQVKIDGVRVELAEVARVIEHAPGVAQCVVLAAGAEGGSPHLTAFVTLADAATDTPNEGALRQFARARLLGSAVPGRILVLETMPTGPTGKTDRQALEAHAAQHGAEIASETSEHTAQSQQIAEIWADVLDVALPGPQADFFALGGTSLRAVVVMSRLSAVFGRYLEPGLIFDHPTPAALADSVIQGDTAQGDEPPLPAVTVRARAERSPMTANQAWLWRLHRDAPQSTAYNLAAGYRLGADVDLDALARAVAAVFERHTSLRTRVHTEGAEASAQCASSPEPDCALIRESDDETSDEALIQRAATRPFDLQQENPARFAIYPRKAGYLLVISVHHMASDGWSAQVIVDDLSRCYAQAVAGRDIPVAPVPQSSDVAHWQNDARPALRDTLDAYVAGLAEAAGPTLAPANPMAPRGGPAERLTVKLDAATLGDLVAQGPIGTTPLGVLCAAWALVLRGFGTHTPLLMGIPRAGRSAPGLEKAVGFFANTVLMSLDPDPAEPWSSVLQQTQDKLRATAPCDMIPLAWVQDAGAGWRADTSEIRTLVVPEDGFDWKLELPGADVHWAGQSRPTEARADVAVVLTRAGAGLSVEIEYDTGRIPAMLGQSLANALACVLKGAARNSRAGAIPLSEGVTTPATFQNDTASSAFAEQRIDARLASWAHAAPDAMAAVGPDGAITAAELEARVAAFASRLSEAGLSRDMAAAVDCQRGLPWLVAILSIWRVGARVVILDPAWPQAQRADICDDANVAMVLDAGTVSFTAPLPTAKGQAIRASADIAALTYTSGTTGRPKGVALAHDALLRLGDALRTVLDVRPGDRILQAAAPAFDVALSDIAMALTARAALVVLPQDDVLAGRNLTNALDREQITHMQVAATVLSNTAARHLPHLRAVAVGGEPCPPATLDAWSKGRALFVAYGPAEATVTATAIRYDAQMPQAALGFPIAGNNLAVLDRFDQPLPPGAVGDIVISGRQIARYLGHAATGANGFGTTDVFGETQPALRTGDRGWMTADGCLVFTGRTDRQLKIRGTRVEPRAVEVALDAHPDVQRALVGHTGDGPERMLVAWATLRSGITDATSEAVLRDWLSARLPKASVPSRIAVLEAWPLTPNGKVDAAALPAPWDAPVEAAVDATATAPETLAEVERLVAALWRDILKRQEIPSGRSFYDCGGDSLSIVALQARLEAALGIDIPVGEMFAHPTLSDMSEMIFSKRFQKKLVEFEI